MISINEAVCTEVYKNERKLESTVTNGFAFVSQKTKVIPLVVKFTILHPKLRVDEGDVVYVKERDFLEKQIPCDRYELEGKEFILVPIDRIVGYSLKKE